MSHSCRLATASVPAQRIHLEQRSAPCENDPSSNPFPRHVALAVDAGANDEYRDHLGRLGETLGRVAHILRQGIGVSGGSAREEGERTRRAWYWQVVLAKFASATLAYLHQSRISFTALGDLRRSGNTRVVRTRRSQSLRKAAVFRLLPRLPQQDPQPDSDREEAVEDDQEGGGGEVFVIRACAAGRGSACSSA